MNQPTPDPAGSVFAPQPPAAPPQTAPAAPPPPPLAAGPPASYKEQAYTVMGRHHGLLGRLDSIERRVTDILASHAALIAHITDQAPAAAAAGTPSAAFYGQVLDQHQVLHGLLKIIKTEAGYVLGSHAMLIGDLESLL